MTTPRRKSLRRRRSSVPQLSMGVLGTSRKEHELRLPIHPAHIDRIDADLRRQIFFERGYGRHFNVSDHELEPSVGGMRSRHELIETCDVILLPKPTHEDVAEMHEGQVLWGWPHCVQDETLTQLSIDRRLTLIAWEAMHYWMTEGTFVHVFHKNNELAGYCSVLHALQLIGTTGEYGRRLRAAVISFGATGRGAVTALNALGVLDVNVLTHRDVHAVASPIHSVRMVHFERSSDDVRRPLTILSSGPTPIAEILAKHDVIVNCVLQDTDAPLMFVTNEELEDFPPGSVFVDVSCDEGMGFEWARPTTFADPMFEVGGHYYYAVDHSPSFLWNSATWEVSDALLPHVGTVMAGPDAWAADQTIGSALEIRDGLILNPRILSFQNRSPEFPHEKLTAAGVG
jgi:alanine dehydrogenase